MLFLADECLDIALARALRAEGHNVAMVAEVCRGAEDARVAEFALIEKRILLTEDKDFGQLVYAYGQGMLGVVFLRYPFETRFRVAAELVELIRRTGRDIEGCFVTVQPGRCRMGLMPKE
jgi:uncharacterized protein with PIN domain